MKNNKKSTRRVLNISKTTMDILQVYCKEKCLSLTDWADRALLNAISSRKSSEYNPTLSIIDKNSTNELELFNLFYVIIDPDQILKEVVEDFITDGNSYFEVKFIGFNNSGVASVTHIPLTEKVTRIENSDPLNEKYVIFKNEKTGQIYERYQILHFRLLTNSENIPYGTPFNMERFNDVGKNGLAIERNNRTIERMSKIISSEFQNLGIVDLYAKGFRNENSTDFKIKINEDRVKIIIEDYYLKNYKSKNNKTR
jgi:hypothetical protein